MDNISIWDFAVDVFAVDTCWKTFGATCGAYDGPPLAWLVRACEAPDGSYWAIQTWQRKLPHRGVDPWLPLQRAFTFDVSHWTGDIASVRLEVDWPRTFNFETEQIFGRMTYAGQPVHGFGRLFELPAPAAMAGAAR